MGVPQMMDYDYGLWMDYDYGLWMDYEQMEKMMEQMMDCDGMSELWWIMNEWWTNGLWIHK